MTAAVTARDDLTRVAMTAVGVGGFLYGIVPFIAQIGQSLRHCNWPWRLDAWLPPEWASVTLIAGLAGVVLLSNTTYPRRILLGAIGASVYFDDYLVASFLTWLHPIVALALVSIANSVLNAIQHRHAMPVGERASCDHRYVRPDGLPKLNPQRIPTLFKGNCQRIPWFTAILQWIGKARNWQVSEDWKCHIGDRRCVIRRNESFTFDGASIPRPLWWILNPIGILLIPGVIHDYGYRYRKLRKLDPSSPGQDVDFMPYPDNGFMNKLYWDKLFIQTAVDINGFRALNTLAGYAVVLFGWTAWWNNRKEEKKRNAGVDTTGDSDALTSVTAFLLQLAISVAVVSFFLCCPISDPVLSYLKWALIVYAIGLFTFFEGFVRLK